MALNSDSLSALDAKSRPAAPAPQQAAPAASQQAQDDDADADKGDSSSSDEEVAASVNLLKLYSNLNAAITDLFDNLGVKRQATYPHQVGQSMADHITDVGTAMRNAGHSVTSSLILATHTRHDPKGGATVAFPSDRLRTTIIPKNFEPAIHATAVCRTLVNKIAALVPDEPAVKQAKSQIALIGQNNLSGMTAFDAGASLIAIIHPLFQLLSRRHQFVKHGEHHPNLTGPKQA
jgi:hypothetical protein